MKHRIETLYKYLEKIGVQETTRTSRNEPPTTYRRETYGDSSYFYNAPGYLYPAAILHFDYNGTGADYYRKQAQLEKIIRTYCRKYGYEVFNEGGYPGGRYFSIATAADRAGSETYYFYRDAARDECERYHNENPDDQNAEKALHAIMDAYGEAYNIRLAEEGRQTA